MKDFLDFEIASKKPTEKVGANDKIYPIKALPIVAKIVDIVALFALAGLLTLVQFKFDINKVVWFVFVGYLALRIALFYFSKHVAAQSRVEHGQNEDAHKKLIEDYKAVVSDIDHTQLKEYIDRVVNPERKKAAYQAKFSRKIQRKQNIISRLKTRIKVLNIKGKIGKSAKIQTKIDEKQAVLDNLIILSSAEFYEANKDNLLVKYKPVSTSQFLVLNLEGEVSAEQYTINVDFENNKGIIKSLPGTLAFIVFTSLVALDNIIFGTFNFLSFILDSISVSSYIVTAWFSIGAKTLAKQRKVIANKIVFLESYKKGLSQ